MRAVDEPGKPTLRAMIGAVLAALLVVVAIYFGSGQLERFDPPLAAYAAATVFAAFAVTYRYIMWIQRPPTWRYFVAGWKLFMTPSKLGANLVSLAVLLWKNIILQTFIERRSTQRWAAHMCLAWGCSVAFAITIPLSWGWVRFGIAPNGVDYQAEVFGFPTIAFPPTGALAFVLFNGLNFSAVAVLVGVALAMHRRLFDRGAQAVESLGADLVPLFILFSVAVTGLILTASYRLMAGANFGFISLLHAFAVIVFLLYLPFGKFFHIIQRPAQLGVAFYKQEGSRPGAPQATCVRSGDAYMSQLHHDDLVKIMQELGYDFGEHQNVSPEEKRKLIALNQAAAMQEIPFVG